MYFVMFIVQVIRKKKRKNVPISVGRSIQGVSEIENKNKQVYIAGHKKA